MQTGADVTARDTRTELDAVEQVNPTGPGPALILCEHASNHFPHRFGDLGLSADARNSHAAWDPGARAVALGLSRALDAPMIASRVSRLLYDCNRPPDAASAMPEQSEKITVPGNRALDPAARQARIDAIYTPFCNAVTTMIQQRAADGLPTALITVHSFTPVYFDQHRAVEIGILHDDDSRLADAMLTHSQRLSHRRIKRNQPYGPRDGVTHTLQRHGIANDLPNVMLEIRNDLLNSTAREQAMTRELLDLIRPALTRIGVTTLGTSHG